MPSRQTPTVFAEVTRSSGVDSPTTWPFELYKAGISDGLKFRAEVIDTWNMTITPVDGEFVAKKKDNYVFEDAARRSIALPGRPCMAIRITRIP